MAKLTPVGDALVYATHFGGARQDEAFGIAVDAKGSIYEAGQTTSTDYPTAPGTPLQAGRAGTDDAFVTKIGEGVEPPPPTVTPTAEPEGG